MSASPLKNRLRALLLAIPFFFAAAAHADPNVTGAWNGFLIIGSSQFPTTITLVQHGTTVTGSTLGGKAPGVISGTQIGTQFNAHVDVPSSGYSSDFSGTTDGKTATGQFSDSNGIAGSFVATKGGPTLGPATHLADPPVVEVHAHSATVTMVNFTKVSLATTKRMLLAAKIRGGANGKLSIQYELTIHSSSVQRRRVSASNIVTVAGLPSGEYTANYRVAALKNGKAVFTTKKSPAAQFTIP
jgi:hypothetical protein